MPQNYSYDPDAGEKILFIIDLSNSMNEQLERDSKYNLMIKTMKEILPKIDPKAEIGLRIYGHRMGFTPIEACRASSLTVPITSNNSTYRLEVKVSDYKKSETDEIKENIVKTVTATITYKVKNEMETKELSTVVVKN